LEERLRIHGFLRAHRRALVRLDSVRELTRDGAGVLTAVLSTGARIPISRRRSADFTAAVRQAGRKNLSGN
jgi:DNA-binding LytR/AlgR family response regulator